MARKPNPTAARAKSSEIAAPERPWLKSYPEGIDWNAKFEPGLVGSLLDDAVGAYGSRPCTYFLGKRLSFAELGELSNRAAKGLSALGVGPGVKVGLFLPNTPTFVIFYYGVLKAGGTVVNFNPLYSLEEIEFQIRDSGTKIMVTLDLALTFDKVEAMLRRGALEKAVVASFPALLPTLKSVGFKLLQRAKLADPNASAAKECIVDERALLANDGRYARPALTPDAVASLDVSERQALALSHIKRNGRITNSEYQKLAGVLRKTAARDLERLVAKGVLKRVGEKRGAHYVLARRK